MYNWATLAILHPHNTIRTKLASKYGRGICSCRLPLPQASIFNMIIFHNICWLLIPCRWMQAGSSAATQAFINISKAISKWKKKKKHFTAKEDFEKYPSSKLLAAYWCDLSGEFTSDCRHQHDHQQRWWVSRACVCLCNHNKQSQREVEMMPGRY